VKVADQSASRPSSGKSAECRESAGKSSRLTVSQSEVRTIPDYMHDGVGYYVYRLVDPRTKQTFYVGKGRGNRLFQHVNEAVANEEHSTLKLDRIREIKEQGLDIEHVVHRHGLSEKEAFEVEAALIDAYGLSRDALSELTNAVGGYQGYRGVMSVEELIGRHASEEAVFDVPVLVLKLSRQYERQMTAEELYERTRGVWVINPLAHRNVNYAVPVSVGGIVRQVYRISRWTQVDTRMTEENPLRRKGVDTPSKTRYRWKFDGVVDETMRERYLGTLVPNVASRGQVYWRGPKVANVSGPEIVKAVKGEPGLQVLGGGNKRRRRH
jgi:uncharacterized protein